MFLEENKKKRKEKGIKVNLFSLNSKKGLILAPRERRE
jgi:hypothetical protein